MNHYVDHFRNSYRDLNLPAVDIAATPKHKRVSFCTTCMNRLHDLRKTLPQNILDNATYPELEFVVLDYASKDGLQEWIKDQMREHIQTGVLNFYRAENHSKYLPSHARNVTFRLARGDIVVNVDADNYVGVGFARRINQCMSVLKHGIVGVPEKFLLPGQNTILLKGRFAMYKADLLNLGGYDEELDEGGGYSHEDLHLILRAMMAGYRVARFEQRHVENRIETPEPERIKHMAVSGSYASIKAINERIIGAKLAKGEIVVNEGRTWGTDIVSKG